MIRNYLKVAFRKLWSHKVYSLINILGLAIGMTATFLIYQYVSFEMSYDTFHSKKDRIYRVVADIKTPTEVIHSGGPSWAVPPFAAQEFPEVEAFVRTTGDDILVRKGDVKFVEDKAMWADSALFKVFDFQLLKGNPNTALKEQFNIVLSETAAKKYFAGKDPMGQTLLVTGDAFPATVTGVMKDIPENSTIKADMFLSMSTITEKFAKGIDSQWGNYGISAYFLVKEGANAKALEKKFPVMLEKYNGTEMRKSQMFATVFLEPLKDVYLRSTRNGSKSGNINNVYIFSIVAIFILLIACINFINLTTARAAERGKEVGIRKVAGAGRKQLAVQFIGESILLCLVAFVCTLLLTSLAVPFFNQLAGKTISTGLTANPVMIIQLLIASILIGLVAGTYPAFVLTSYKPVVVLKGRFATGTKGIMLRKGLVVAQFTISIGLIIATIVVYNQMSYMRNQDLGFNKDHMLIIDSQGDPAKKSFVESLSSMPGISSVATSRSVPGGGNPGAYSEIENIKGELQVANLDLYFVDFDYLPHYDIKMVAGRAFSKQFGTDTTQAMVLNEAAVKMFGYTSPQQAIGKRFKQWGREGKIVGVMKDFHFKGLQQPIKPLSMRIDADNSNLVSVNIRDSKVASIISTIESKWKSLVPNKPFSYFFLDESYDKQYRTEERFGRLFLNFAILAIIISCLGLLGLASYSTMQRTKEIGIRKILGASVSGITNLLTKEFLLLVIISFVIAAPVAWYAMYKWLQDFAYHTKVDVWVFVLAGGSAMMIALFTVSFQAIKAAVSNPVKSLRTE